MSKNRDKNELVESNRRKALGSDTDQTMDELMDGPVSARADVSSTGQGNESTQAKAADQP